MSPDETPNTTQDNGQHFGFSKALRILKQRGKVARRQFRDTCHIEAQYPDVDSKMTKPYLIMIKGADTFPVDLSCESIFAHDWYFVGPAEVEETEDKLSNPEMEESQDTQNSNGEEGTRNVTGPSTVTDQVTPEPTKRDHEGRPMAHKPS